MPFEHTATTQWGRWLRAVFAGRPPGTQVIGQQMEDELRGVVQVADLRNLAEPIRWAQAFGRRQTGSAVGDVGRVELHCLSPGGLWVDEIGQSTAGVFIQIAEAPVSVPDRVGIVDVGQIPTVSLLGQTLVTEAALGVTTPQLTGGAFTIRRNPPIYVPFGKVLLLLAISQNSVVNVELISWREIPAPR